MPADVHTAKSFQSYLSILKKAFADPSALEDGSIDAPLLLLGLLYREVCRSMEMEPGSSTMAPPHLVNSFFGVPEMDKIERLISGVRLPSGM